MITLTEKAANEIKQLLTAQDLPKETGLRIGVRGGGCSGLTYTLNFDVVSKDSDKIIDSNGIKVLVDTKSFLFLAGTTLDYIDGINGSGFSFNNPNAINSCGCCS